jgi:chemotaxis protein methyltransferase CheR
MHAMLTDAEFNGFQRFIFEAAGIHMSPAKKSLVAGRLAKRLKARQLQTYAEYQALLRSGQDAQEVQTAIDLLTTNETYFFREGKHFDVLRQEAEAAAQQGRGLRVWSAAASSGEEAYSIAMVLADATPQLPWSVLGTDISQRVLQRARTGHYPQERARQIPPAYLKRFCLKGVGEQEGTVLVRKALRERVQFLHMNLDAPLPAIGRFDVVFLRNVMIYFNAATKREVVARVVAQMEPGGCLCIGHSESLSDMNTGLLQLAPSVYRKPAA